METKIPNPISGEYETYYNGKLWESVKLIIEAGEKDPNKKLTDDLGKIIRDGQCGAETIDWSLVDQLDQAGLLRPYIWVTETWRLDDEVVRRRLDIKGFVMELDKKRVPSSPHPKTRLELRPLDDNSTSDDKQWVLERRKIVYNQ